MAKIDETFDSEIGSWTCDTMFIACSICGIGMIISLNHKGPIIHKGCMADRENKDANG